MKKWTVILICLILTCLIIVSGSAEETALEITLYGMTMQDNGMWHNDVISASFMIYQDDRPVGEVMSGQEGRTVLSLPGGDEVLLVPVAGSVTPGFAFDPQGYAYTVFRGEENHIRMILYSDSGLFQVQGEAGHTYTVRPASEGAADPAGFTVLTDADGMYLSASPVPSGEYLLTDPLLDGSGVPFSVIPYQGRPEDITLVTADQTAPVSGTDADAATEDKRVNSVSVPESSLNHLIVAFSYAGSDPMQACTCQVFRDGVPVAEQIIQADSMIMRAKLEEGRYNVEIHLPDQFYLHQLNGYDINMDGKLTWEVNLTEDETQEASLRQYTEVRGRLADSQVIEKAELVSGSDTLSGVLEGEFYAFRKIMPGYYTLNLILRPGLYTGDGWSFSTLDDGKVKAVRDLIIDAEYDVLLPDILPVDSQEPSEQQEPRQAEEILTETTQAVETQETRARLEQVKAAYPSTARLLMDDAEANVIDPRELPERSVQGDAGIFVTAFIDSNHNGERGLYERPLPGTLVEVILVDPTSGDAVVASQITDATGEAAFENLCAGTYRLRTTLPVYYGYGEKGKTRNSMNSNIMERQSAQLQESDPFELEEGGRFYAGIAGVPTSSVSGQVWLDVNADGIRQADEPGQAGVLVEMEGLRNGLTYQILTDEDGYYNFTQLRLGGYKLRCSLPDGFMFTSYNKNAKNNKSIFAGTEGKTVMEKTYDLNKATHETEQNIGVCAESVIVGLCFLDANYNGLYDAGEQVLPGVAVTLYKQGNAAEIGRAVSGEDGTYRIPALRAGMYRVKAVLPDDGMFFTKTGEGDEANAFRRVASRQDSTVDALSVGTNQTIHLNVGAVIPASVTGRVYMDRDFSGRMDSGEQAMAGLTVTLIGPDGNVAGTTKTENDGRYLFTGLVPGSYVLSMNAPEGYAFTRTGPGNVMISRSGNYGTSEPFEVVIGTEVQDMDCGVIVPGIVRGTFYADVNDNGQMDGSEGGLQNVQIHLTGEDGTDYSTLVNASGAYAFESVLPGSYQVAILLPTGAVFGSGVSTETWNILGSMATGPSFRINAGDTINLETCSGLLLGRVSGQVYLDAEGKGQWSEQSQGLADAALTLVRTNSGETLKIETGDDGAFDFTGLRPGTYQLTFSIPDEMVLSKPGSYSLPLKVCENTQTISFEVQMGQVREDERLGCVKPASLSGVVWLDENRDGRMGEDERRLQDEVIHVMDLDSGEELLSLVTDSDGMFASEGMIPGQYRLVYELNEQTIPSPEGDSDMILSGDTLVSSQLTLKGGDRAFIHVGLMRYARISGYVWVDLGGEYLPLENAEITLYDAQDNVRQSIRTAADGSYHCDKLLPDQYRIGVRVPEGYVVVEPADERLEGDAHVSVMTACQGQTGQSDLFRLRMDADYDRMDIGCVLPGSLGDMVWLDTNYNGLIDSDEGGIAGMTLHLMRNGEEIRTAVTDAYGYYRMDGLYPAVYTIRADMPTEVRPTVQVRGMTGISSVMKADGVSDPVQVISNACNYNADLGFVPVEDGVYPSGYNNGDAQNWTKLGSAD